MKRLRLRKIWVVLAVLLLMAPLLNRMAGRAMATQPTTPGTGNENPSLGYSINFLVYDEQANDGAGGYIPDDGSSMPQFDLTPPENSGTGFETPNAASIKAMIMLNGEEAVDLTSEYTIQWKCYVNGQDIMTQTDNDVMSLNPIGSSVGTSYVCDMMAKAAGILRFQFEVVATSTTNPDFVMNISRNALITVPLQIYNKNTSGGYYRYAYVEPNGNTDVLVNNAASSDVHWYYLDLETDEYIKLENPATFERNEPKSNSYLVTSVGAPVKDTNETKTVYRYNVVAGQYGGISKLVARVYLNNDSQSDNYIEQTFDFLIKAKTKTGFSEIDLEYGESKRFQDISNDHGDSLEWYEGENNFNTTFLSGVVDLVKGTGVVGKNWGVAELYLTSVPAFKSWEVFQNINNQVKDRIVFKTKFSVLKGEVIEERVKVDSYEVVDMGGKITLSTNVAGTGHTYTWEYFDGGAWIDITSSATRNDYLEYVTGVSSAGADNKSMIVLKGVKPGLVELRCIVRGGEIDSTAEGELKQTLTIKVVDSITLSESRKTIPVGTSFELNAYTSSTGTITWTSSNENYVTVDPTGSTVTVTGVAVSGNEWITITATQVSSGRTATCRVKVVEALSTVTIEGDTVIAKDGLGNLELVFSGRDPGYTKDEIKWVLKNKNGVEADTILSLEESEADIKKATIRGLEVGEAYVAVVANDSVQTEIAVTTVRVVTSPEGLEIDAGEKVIDYLQSGSYTLKATVLPKGYVDEELEILWSSNNEAIATVEVEGDDTKVAVVTYHAVGDVRITAVVKGIPSATDFCDFNIQNPATGVELEPSGEYRMKVGETVQMKATVVPDNVTDASVTWSSSDESIVTVDKYGLVTAVAAGSATVTVTTSNGLKNSCIIIVLTPTEGIELNYTNVTVKKGTIFYLSAKVTPDSAYDKSVTFTSSDDTIATVESDGTVTTLKVGTVEILVTSNDKPELSAICTVTVIEAVSGLTLNSREETIKVGEQFLLKATVRPSDAVNTAVTFESADPSIATVDENGLITGVKGGVTVIIVKTVERGLMASCTITVQEDITSITLSETETYVGKGKNKKITATILPTSATKKKLLWTSSDESIVIVDHEGNIHGVNLGTAIITATAQDDGKISATCKVTVVDETTEIILNQSIIRIMQNDTYQLTYTIRPDYASVKRVSWSTSDASVARVDSLGLVTGIGEGEAKIRATAADGSGVYAECTVIVKPLIPATSVTVNTSSTTMIIGDSRTLTARMLPRSTTEGLRWVSDDTSVVRIDNNGNATAVGPGVCHVTAISSVTGLEGSCTITVLGMNASTVTLEQYDTFDLYLDGVTGGVTWFSRNKRVATVSKKGLVTARREGTTDIVARVNGKMVSCEITVEKLKK
ncbi:MAG: Ig-like domain-containing protein [Lachnospiraceae bacterium]|nr:Ig-like domain-containing protein [Lachnospiraceae bacterium]